MLLRASDGIRGRVIDLDTGRVVRKVISLNTDTGYLEAYRVDSNGEILKDSEGNYLIYSAVGRFKYERWSTDRNTRNIANSSTGNAPRIGNSDNPPPTILLSEKLVVGAPKCARCPSNLTLPGDDLCPTCRARQGTQKHPMKVERIINPLLDRKCENCSRLATWSVSDEVVVTPEPGGICVCGHPAEAHSGHCHPKGTVEPTYCSQGCGCKLYRLRRGYLYERGMTVGRRYYCSWHYTPPRLLDAKGEVVREFEDNKVRPQ